MRRGGYIAFSTLLVCMLLISGCGNDATGGTTVNPKQFVTEYPEVEYKAFKQGDLFLAYPDWEEFESGGDERQLSLKKGTCTLAVNKCSAIPGDLIMFLKNKIVDSGYVLEDFGKGKISYDMPREADTVFSQMKLKYCNHQMYTVAILCIKENYDKYHEEIVSDVFSSIECLEEYDAELPHISNNPINESVVKVLKGELYGIDDYDVVYHINRNPYLTGMLKKFDKINLQLERQENGLEVKLKIELSAGKVVSVDRGHFPDAGVTIYMPLMDALNLFSSIDIVDAKNIGIFTENLQTQPESIRQIILG